LYLRARYYQPEVGRFVTEDPWMGDTWRPGSLNRYVYVVNNPVNFIDPTGRIPPIPSGDEDLMEASKKRAADLLESEYALHLVNPSPWHEQDISIVYRATGDLAHFMGGRERFRSEMPRSGIFVWRAEFASPLRSAAEALSSILNKHVVYYAGASWGDPPELMWQTVHELAHVWDMNRGLLLSTELLRETNSRYVLVCRVPIPLEYEPGGDWLEGRPEPPNALEDWAEAVASYVYTSHAYLRGKMISPLRWDFVRRYMQEKEPYPSQWIYDFYDPSEVPPLPADFPRYRGRPVQFD
jgi:hypothetical protein